jgi:hypothetical protein
MPLLCVYPVVMLRRIGTGSLPYIRNHLSGRVRGSKANVGPKRTWVQSERGSKANAGPKRTRVQSERGSKANAKSKTAKNCKNRHETHTRWAKYSLLWQLWLGIRFGPTYST